jgi:hypothetical protein
MNIGRQQAPVFTSKPVWKSRRSAEQRLFGRIIEMLARNTSN